MTSPLRVGVRRPPGPEPDIELWLHVPSRLDLVGEAVDLLTAQTERERHNALSARQLRFHFRTALAEALANAIAYGNRHDRARLVRVRVEVSRDAVHLHVTDEGSGFDPADVPDPTRPDRLQREDGRGLFVLKSLVDQVVFNEKGNSVCLTLRAG